MNSEPSRFLPFGDKNAMLVIVFLVLSLGIGSLRSDRDEAPVSSLHPALITINQQAQGFLGIEKLAYLSVNEDYFVDEPILRPSGLDEHSLVDATNFVGRGNAGPNYKELALNNALSDGSIFRNAGALPENTGVASFNTVDTDIVLSICKTVMLSKDPYLTKDGQCKRFQDLPEQKVILDKVQPLTSIGDFRCFRNKCNSDRDGMDISFSGVASSAWNGAAISYKNRSAFNQVTRVRGMMCFLESTSQESFLGEVESLQNSKDHMLVYGTTGYRLFSGDLGFTYYKERIKSNAKTSLEISTFDPNKKNSVTQSILNFNGIKFGEPLQDGITFATKAACQIISEYVKNTEAFAPESLPIEYPSQMLRTFELKIKSGEIIDTFGVDKIESR